MVRFVQFVVNRPVFDTFFNSPDGTVGRWLKRKGSRIVAAAKSQVGVRTGALRASIHMRHMRDPRGQYLRIGSSLGYARLHHEGSRPHLILPKKRQVLKFYSRGQIVMTHMVRHPGTRPNRYLSDNLKLIR
jgi:hypothetical protein